MSRHTSCEAIVLHQAPLSEIHANLSLLTRENGVVRVVAHGIRGKSSSLRAQCQTYSRIRAYLYEDPQKQTKKLSDAELLEDFPSVRENLQTIYCAALCAEVLSKSPLHTQDSWAFDLFGAWLRFAARPVTPYLVENATTQFMWRYLEQSGFIPDLYHCAQSGAALEDSDKIAYSPSLGGFVAIGSLREHDMTDHKRDTRIAVTAGALPYLRFSLEKNFDQAVAVGLASDARKALLKLSIDLVQDTLGYPLKSIKDPELLFLPS